MKYAYTLNADVKEAVVLFKLCLFDCATKNRFGDQMTGICTVIREREEPR